MSENQSSDRERRVEKQFFKASAVDFRKIPGSPIAYWLPRAALKILDEAVPLGDVSDPRKGMCTRDNDYFVRLWPEVSFGKVGFGLTSRQDAKASGKRWFPYQKGGEFRQWYGNQNSVVDWENDGYRLLNMENLGWKGNSTNHNLEYIFKPAIVWSKITSSIPSFRRSTAGFLYDDASGMCRVSNDGDSNDVLGFLCSKVGRYYMEVINPTLNIQPGNMAAMPFLGNAKSRNIDPIVEVAKLDWDAYESSWDFTVFPLLHPDHRESTLRAGYQKLRSHWREMTLDMQRLEQENNSIFINAYGLQDELTPEVPLSEVTLTCNPHYRYGGDKTEEELEILLRADAMRDLVSYAVGCMLGRYSLDKPGLILADQGETLADYLAQVPEPSFPADDDNVIPVLDGDWFADDITLRFRQFLRVAFGEEHYDENLAFIEQVLNVKSKRNYSLRDYFLSEFYADHVKRYKKRPIYWQFSSPKGSFSALIYMHRYRPDTVSVVLKYLRDYRKKLNTEKERQASASITPATSQGDKTRALKEVERLAKVLTELEDYERDVLYPLATEQKVIDLDDGVKVNYLKLGAALKKITGLDAKEED
jgi:hypothetical protein